MDINNYKNNRKKSKNNINKSFKKFLSDFISRTMICIVLVLLCMILIKLNHNYRSYIKKYIYENNFNFTYVKNLYNKYLGGVIPFDSFLSTEQVFNEKLSYNSIEKYKDGAKLIVNNGYLVPSIDGGIIVYIGDKDDYGKVVIVQQNNGIDVWYGNVNSTLSMYDYVEKGELIGEVIGEEVYLVFEKEGKFLDYKNYV